VVGVRIDYVLTNHMLVISVSGSAFDIENHLISKAKTQENPYQLIQSIDELFLRLYIGYYIKKTEEVNHDRRI
tara:strand:- start:273 stop:491 length:219 start_codon:yes stop_codon:yes gene_type:complete